MSVGATWPAARIPGNLAWVAEREHEDVATTVAELRSLLDAFPDDAFIRVAGPVGDRWLRVENVNVTSDQDGTVDAPDGVEVVVQWDTGAERLA